MKNFLQRLKNEKAFSLCYFEQKQQKKNVNVNGGEEKTKIIPNWIYFK